MDRYSCLHRVRNKTIYPVHGANLTVIQSTWSAYPYHCFFLYDIRITWFSKYGIDITCFPLYGNAVQTFICKRHSCGYGVAMGCLGRCIVSEAATVKSQ